MTKSLTLKLILIVLVVSLIGPLLVTAVTIRTTSAQFQRFLQDRDAEGAVTFLQEYFLDNGSWVGINDAATEQLADSRGSRRGRAPQMGVGRGNPILEWAAADDTNTIIVAGLDYSLGDEVQGVARQLGIPITVDGQDVAYVLLPPTPFKRVLIGAEVLFLARVYRAVIFGALGGIVIALVVGALLARALTRPPREMTAATSTIVQRVIMAKGVGQRGVVLP